MKRMLTGHKKALLLIPLMFLASCAALQEEIASLRKLLTDLSSSTEVSASTTGEEAANDDANRPPGETKECRGKPPHEACASDGAKFCADLVPTRPEGPPSKASFESRRDQVREFMDCLKEHESELSAECLDVVQNPPPPPQAGQGNRRAARGGQRPPPPPPPCGGSTEMAACRSDARTYCSDELLTPDEVPTLDRDAMHERADAIVDCLNLHAAQISAACTTAIANRAADEAAKASGSSSTSSQE